FPYNSFQQRSQLLRSLRPIPALPDCHIPAYKIKSIDERNAISSERLWDFLWVVCEKNRAKEITWFLGLGGVVTVALLVALGFGWSCLDRMVGRVVLG
ncbi:MAG TPA: hypothetical protein PLJ47_16015, partial [Candidatus Hydrogenedentes bacterium]|nr:hypothetical protein [Candidatus Hydrogenedentota bacterium]